MIILVHMPIEPIRKIMIFCHVPIEPIRKRMFFCYMPIKPIRKIMSFDNMPIKPIRKMMICGHMHIKPIRKMTIFLATCKINQKGKLYYSLSLAFKSRFNLFQFWFHFLHHCSCFVIHVEFLYKWSKLIQQTKSEQMEEKTNLNGDIKDYTKKMQRFNTQQK
jgi:hypothetical protein